MNKVTVTNQELDANGEAKQAAMPKSKNTVKAIPIGDREMYDLADRVAIRWLTEPDYVLKYMTAADFHTLVQDFGIVVNTRQNVGATRSPITVQLAQLDKMIDSHLKYIKNYLEEKYNTKTEATAHYGQFGIVRSSNIYVIPKDRNTRRAALQQLLAGVVTEGFGNNKYGTSFWQPIVTNYLSLADQAIQTDGTVSLDVSTKTLQKAKIRQVITALYQLIKLNNPDTYKGELRSWGFQKEKQ